MKQVGIKWPEELIQKVDEAAERAGVPRSAYIRHAVEKALGIYVAAPKQETKSARSAGVPKIAGMVPASQIKPPSQTECKHTNALVHRGGGRYSCRRCGEVVEGE